MVQILYERTNDRDSHENRARVLSEIIAGSHYALVDTVATQKLNLDTLIFWGHGTAHGLCGKTPQQLAQIIKNWKAQNSRLNTVELITCDARHIMGNRTDSYSNNLKLALKTGFLSSTRNIILKALPLTVGGMTNASSILVADYGTKSWVYITAPRDERGNDYMMMQVYDIIKRDKVTKKLLEGDVDVAQRADEMVREYVEYRGEARKWTMNYGYFNTLRSHLVVV
jgi:hypothetical protein